MASLSAPTSAIAVPNAARVSTRAVRASRPVASLKRSTFAGKALKLNVQTKPVAGRNALTAQARMADWDQEMALWLLQNKVSSISRADVAAAQDAGAILIDVRMSKDYENVHAEGAKSVPLFRDIESWDAKSVLRRAVYAFNGMKGSEENPAFAEEMAAAVGSKDARVLVMCDSGGTYEPTPQFMRGKKSRSWQAIYLMLAEQGYTNVVHVEGGLRDWARDEMPVEGVDVEAWKAKASAMP